MEWTVRPLDDRPVAGVVALVVIIGFGVFVSLLAGDWIWGVLAVVALFATVTRFYLPSRITISDQGILAEFPLVSRRVAWNEVAWIRHDQQSALVRTTRKRFRGREFTILFGREHERAIDLLQVFAPPGLVTEVGGKEGEA